MADDEFDDEQDGVEPDLDLNEVVRIEAGEGSGERLLLGEFYMLSRPPTAGGAAGALSNGSRDGSARSGGLMNAGAAGDLPLMQLVTPGARRAATETFRKEEPAAPAPVPGASSKMDANVKPKTSAVADTASAGAVTDSWRHRGVFESFEAAAHTARRERVLVAQRRGGTTPRTHGGSN